MHSLVTALPHGFGSLSLEGRFRVVDGFGVLFGKFRDLVFDIGFDCLDYAHQTVQVGLERFRIVALEVDWLSPLLASHSGERTARKYTECFVMRLVWSVNCFCKSVWPSTLTEEETSVSSGGRLGSDASAERTYLQW